jgi:asparagine synthase (glutamine-hydrolysing)
MSVQFGICNLDGTAIEPEELDAAREFLAPFGPDGDACYCGENFGLLYRAFHTTAESRGERQPHIAGSGRVFAWDGRLDNREEILGELGEPFGNTRTDLSILVLAYERWGPRTLGKLIGDWALAIWEPETRALALALDVIGLRQLYYS